MTMIFGVGLYIGHTEKLRTHGYYVLKVKQGPIRDPCTRAHGKLAMPLVWLIGFEEVKLNGSKLPSNRHVLSIFSYHHTSLKTAILESSTDIIREAVQFWDNVQIPIQPEHCAIWKHERP